MDNKENVTRILLICSTCQGKLVIFFIYTTKENLSRKTCQGKLASVYSRQVFLDKSTCQGKLVRVNGALPFADNSFLSDLDEYSEQKTLSDAENPKGEDDNSLKQIVTILNSSPKNLKIAHLNICSIRYKIDELRVLQSICGFNVIAITETHLDGSISDNRLHIEGMVLFRPSVFGLRSSVFGLRFVDTPSA